MFKFLSKNSQGILRITLIILLISFLTDIIVLLTNFDLPYNIYKILFFIFLLSVELVFYFSITKPYFKIFKWLGIMVIIINFLYLIIFNYGLYSDLGLSLDHIKDVIKYSSISLILLSSFQNPLLSRNKIKFNKFFAYLYFILVFLFIYITLKYENPLHIGLNITSILIVSQYLVLILLNIFLLKRGNK